ncbi:MAG: sigma-54 dependent transcriptional regulator [Bacteroidales bacterium]|jgi:transcriptional regulator with PAS, ATPase and Fis domain|nr:sigma-54-dependent Fis family transcriptional regulator [Lentimicrobiaceae bacterium]MDG1135801.1 sigma-54 dependent transcriptional regulator [Bacteroidales bacterium]MDG1901396.1 sigma-54 dependent transcriptional regulator [Bacteroidales bacterium]MDG2080930.1 sigma-54 dependent transcriptional regulator [Bacteroidales bacterium]|tara:strand:+ start:952 stop:2184 length:1233 start_codon:yes stop_codon:yes gene_type:complete
MDVQSVKQRFGIIGNSDLLNRAIDIAMQVAPTDLTVLISGESGTGKEVFPKIIHQFGSRKHGNYIAVNCGAIPEGTIDSELFGHEKGSFTGAHEARKGYFEVVDGGTIFLDEVAELPLSTQVRLLRVLETGEFLKVGSSKVIKTNVRVVAASNVNLPKSIDEGKFRQDLYYRLNTIPVYIPPLRERKDDIHLIFRKFTTDFAEKYRMPPIRLTDDAQTVLRNFYWPGNIRQLKNVTEQISIIEREKLVDGQTLRKYLPNDNTTELPVLYKNQEEGISERELLYKVLFDMKKDMNDLKKIVLELIEKGDDHDNIEQTKALLVKDFGTDLIVPDKDNEPSVKITHPTDDSSGHLNDFDHSEIIEESLSLQDKEREMIKKALEKHRGKRKNAAEELGISERTLYRKIKEYNIK